MKFNAFPSIEGFHNLVKYAAKWPQYVPDQVTYRMKIKLHGTNAAVRVSPDGEVAFQSRSQIITPENDNAGFARWGTSHLEYFKSLADPGKVGDLTVYGEWCGPGIMKGTAISSVPNRMFVVFAILLEYGTTVQKYSVNPTVINSLLMEENPGAPRPLIPSDLKVLPFYGDAFVIDFKDRNALMTTADTLNETVSKIEPCDPWVKAEFGVEGVCEGIVCYPVNPGPFTDVWDEFNNSFEDAKKFSDLTFKAKGEQHRVTTAKVAVQVDPEVLKSVEQFVSTFCTVPRYEQGLAAIGGTADMKRMGEFLKWVGQDVQKESEAERESSGLDWGQLAKPVQTAARNWFAEKSKQI